MRSDLSLLFLTYTLTQQIMLAVILTGLSAENLFVRHFSIVLL